jgi:hypothetical protein
VLRAAVNRAPGTFLPSFSRRIQVIGRAQIIVSYGLTLTLKHILEGQGGLALSLHNTAERQGKILDEHLATVCRLREDRIYSIDTYLSDVDMVNSFFVL